MCLARGAGASFSLDTRGGGDAAKKRAPQWLSYLLPTYAAKNERLWASIRSFDRRRAAFRGRGGGRCCWVGTELAPAPSLGHWARNARPIRGGANRSMQDCMQRLLRQLRGWQGLRDTEGHRTSLAAPCAARIIKNIPGPLPPTTAAQFGPGHPSPLADVS